MEDNQTPRSYVSSKLPEHRRWILLKLQDVAAYDSVEGLIERHFAGIALVENHVAQRPICRSRPRCFKGCQNSVHADNFAHVTNHARGKEGDIASAATDVQHTHAGDNPGFLEEPPRDRVDKARLRLQTLDLSVGMTQHISVSRTSRVTSVTHMRSSSGRQLDGMSFLDIQ